MRFDKVFTSVWSVILLWNLVNAKITIKRRHESSSTKPTSSLPISSSSKEVNSSGPLKPTSRVPLKSTSIVQKKIGRRQISSSEERVDAEFYSLPESDEKQTNQDLEQDSDELSQNDQLEMAPMVEGMDDQFAVTKELSNTDNIIINRVANGVANSPPKWQYGIVPYRVDENTYDNLLKVHLKKAMDIIETASCIKFKEMEELSDGMTWLHFRNPDRTRECVHTTTQGDNGDVVITLGLECMKTRDLLHSILHGLGFNDEVSHPHRDQYIRILWENIQPKYKGLFTISHEEPDKLVEYDPMSIMHFHDRAYSSNGGLTIAPVMYGLVINPSEKLSQLDVMKLRLAFGHECNKRKVGDIVQNCKNVLYKKNVGDDENIDDNDKKEKSNEDNDNDNESDNKDDDGFAKRQTDVDVSDSNTEEIQIKEQGAVKIKADEIISAGDDLQARRFPSHLKFKNMPQNKH